MNPHLDELMTSGRVTSASLMRCNVGRPYLCTLYGPQHRVMAEAYGDRANDALRNALGKLLTVAPPYPMPPGL